MKLNHALGAALLCIGAAVSSVASAADPVLTGPTLKKPIAPQTTLPQLKPATTLCARPVFENMTPYEGPAGATITLTGRCFGPVSGRHTVSFVPAGIGGYPKILTVRSWSDTQIVAAVPADTHPDYYNVYVHVWHGDQKRSSNHRNFRVLDASARTPAPRPAIGAQVKPGTLKPQMGLPQPQIKPGALARSCPDLEPSIRVGWPGRYNDGSYTFKLLMYVHNRGNAAFVTDPRQVGINVYEGSRLVETRRFPPNAVPPGGKTDGFVHAIERWSATSEFTADYKVEVLYDPDIRMDNNPQNDDCVMTNNAKFLTAAEIRRTLESTTVPSVGR